MAGLAKQYIAGQWRDGASEKLLVDRNPLNGDMVGEFVVAHPVGVVGVISPFNFPFFLTMKCVAPALATGNGVVVKPHEETPIAGGTPLASIFEEAGLPPGLLNVTVTEIAVIGGSFLEHPVPRVLAFTGSSAVGRHVGEVAARHFKKAILELGGNSAFIVRADADLEYAVDAAVFSRFTHQGQICMSANRLLVHSSVAAEFKDRFVAKVSALTTGDPTAPETIIGPLINARAVAGLERQVEAAVEAGARVLVRGETAGNVFAPVVLENVSPKADVARDPYLAGFEQCALLVVPILALRHSARDAGAGEHAGKGCVLPRPHRCRHAGGGPARHQHGERPR